MNMEKENPKVSIIIPVYNGEKYVNLAIDSALRQTYDNIEVIVVNDGSKDGTDKICRSYGDKIKYISKENGGTSTALNLGIKNMTGDYFSWLSHDDLYYPEKVQTEIEYLRNNKLLYTNTILYSNYSFMDSNGKLLQDMILNSYELNKDSAFSILKGGINGLTLLIPKKAFDDVGLFNTELKCLQDYAKWFDMYKYGYKFIHIKDVLTVTRLHPESSTNTNPRVVSEGNAFWNDTIKSFDDTEKIRLYGSVYNYYNCLFYFFNGGPYNKAVEYCKLKLEEIKNKNKEKINKKVSIILPFDDDISSCIKAINSVLNQTYKNIELVLINNGSHKKIDKILKIVNENKKIINYINLAKKDKKSNVWNKGIKVSTGDYIAFLEQKDSFEKNKVEIQLLEMICSETPISHTSYYNFTENYKTIAYSSYLSGIVNNLVLLDDCISISTVMIDKSYIINNNILFNEMYEPAEEICFYSDIIKNKVLVGIKMPLSNAYNRLISGCNLSKINSVIKYIIDNNKLYENKDEMITLLKTQLNYLDPEGNSNIDYSSSHEKELYRYQYLQSEEWKKVDTMRKKINKLFLRKNRPTYLLDNNALMNSRINRYYNKKYNKNK